MSPMISLPLTTEHALLGFLRQRPMYGYEIHQQLEDPTGLGQVWRLKQSRLYSLLVKLEREGYVTTTLEPQESRPPRKVFALTDAGAQAFRVWVQSAVPRGRKFRLDFLAKLYFARREGPEVTRRLIEAQRQSCRDWLAAEHMETAGLQEVQPYQWLVHQFRTGQVEAMLAWLDTCEKILAGQPA